MDPVRYGTSNLRFILPDLKKLIEFPDTTIILQKRAIMGMHGRGGQHIVIDFERSRIVVTNAIYENFNFPKIVYQTIKKGS